MDAWLFICAGARRVKRVRPAIDVEARPVGISVLLGLALLGGCSQEIDPIVVAQDAAAGYWPANSRLAVRESIAAGYAAVELDLTVSSDGIPIFNRGRAVSASRCTDAYGLPLEADVPIAETTGAELRREYRCGGLPDPAHPNARLEEDTLLGFGEFLSMMKVADPDQKVILNLQWREGEGDTADATAEAVLSRWQSADRPNPLVVSSDEPALIAALESWGDWQATDVQTAFIWPSLAETIENDDVVRMSIASGAGVVSLAQIAQESGADALFADHRLVDRFGVRTTVREGTPVSLYTVNDRVSLYAYRGWPVEALITDYPEDGW